MVLKEICGVVLRRLDEVTERNPRTIVLMAGINDVAAGSSSSEILRNTKETVITITSQVQLY